MRKWLMVAGMVAVVLAGGYLGLSYYAVRLIQNRLEKVASPGLTVGEMEVKPTHLSIRNIGYEDPQSKQKYLRIEEIRIYPDLLSPMKGVLAIRECSIHRPSLFFVRSRDGSYTGLWVPPEKPETGKETFPREEGPGRVSLLLRIHRFRMEKGSVDFEDEKTDGPPTRISLREVDLVVREIQYPAASAHSSVELNCKMKGVTKDGEIQARGWIDFKTFDMDVPLKLRGVELKMLEPYYRKKITADIASGDMDLDVNMVIKNGKIDAPGEMSLAHLQLSKDEGMVFYLPAKLLISLLKDRGNQVKARFQMKGDLNDPQFDFQESFVSRIAFSLAEALGFPIKGLSEIVTGGSLKGAKGLAEGMKSIGEIFRSKKEPRK